MRMFSHCLALDAICTTTTAPSDRWEHTKSPQCSPSFHVISSLVMTGTMPGSPNATMPAKRLLICPAFLNETQNGQVIMRHILEAETVYGPLRDATRGLSLDTDVVLHPPAPITISPPRISEV